MTKTIKLIASITAIAVFAVACGGSMSSASPKEVLGAFFERLAKKDIDGAAKLATKDSKPTLDIMKKGLEMEEKKDGTKDDKQAEEEMKNMELGEAKIEGDIASVPVKNKKKGTEFNFPMKKEDGAWKVNFTMAALKGMAGEKDSEAGMDGEHHNMDAADMQKGMEMADSIMKNMDPEQMEKMKDAIEKMNKVK
jgi:hypothetical protein